MNSWQLKFNIVDVVLLIRGGKVDSLIRKQVKFFTEESTSDRRGDLEDDVSTSMVIAVEDGSFQVVGEFDQTFITVESVTEIVFEFTDATLSSKKRSLEAITCLKKSTVLSRHHLGFRMEGLVVLADEGIHERGHDGELRRDWLRHEH